MATLGAVVSGRRRFPRSMLADLPLHIVAWLALISPVHLLVLLIRLNLSEGCVGRCRTPQRAVHRGRRMDAGCRGRRHQIAGVPLRRRSVRCG